MAFDLAFDTGRQREIEDEGEPNGIEIPSRYDSPERLFAEKGILHESRIGAPVYWVDPSDPKRKQVHVPLDGIKWDRVHEIYIELYGEDALPRNPQPMRTGVELVKRVGRGGGVFVKRIAGSIHAVARRIID